MAHGYDGGRKRTGDHARYRGALEKDEADDDDRRYSYEQRVEVELGRDYLLEGYDAARVEVLSAAGVLHAEHYGDDADDDVRRPGRPHHCADVVEEVRARNCGREVRRVGERGHFVSEVGSGDDESCGQRSGDVKAGGDAYEGDADRRADAPRGAYRDAYYRADEQRGEKENAWRKKIKAVIDKSGDDAGLHPGSDEHAYRYQYQKRAERRCDGVEYGDFHILPRNSDDELAYERRGGRRHRDRHVSVHSESEKSVGDNRRDDDERSERYPKAGFFVSCCHFCSSASLLEFHNNKLNKPARQTPQNAGGVGKRKRAP